MPRHGWRRPMRRIAEAEQRAQAAEQRGRGRRAGGRRRGAQRAAAAAAAVSARQSEEAEVEQAAKTLLMAKRTAEATVNEARGQAQSLLEDSQNRAQRQLNEANAEAAELIRRANEQAEAEFADRRAAVLDGGPRARGPSCPARRRDHPARVPSGRLPRGARPHCARSSSRWPRTRTRLGARPNMSMAPDEVLSSSPTPPPIRPTARQPTPRVGATAGSDLADARPAPAAEVRGRRASRRSRGGRRGAGRESPATDRPTASPRRRRRAAPRSPWPPRRRRPRTRMRTTST